MSIVFDVLQEGQGKRRGLHVQADQPGCGPGHRGSNLGCWRLCCLGLCTAFGFLCPSMRKAISHLGFGFEQQCHRRSERLGKPLSLKTESQGHSCYMAKKGSDCSHVDIRFPSSYCPSKPDLVSTPPGVH